jgi:hypothetical protein
MTLFFSLASVAKVANTPISKIDRFEVWAKVVFVVFQKGHGLRPRFLSKQSFYTTFVEDRRQRSQTIAVEEKAKGVYTARNTDNNHSYTVTIGDAVKCHCHDYQQQIAFIGRGCCKHGYAALRTIGFNSLSEWEAARVNAPVNWPTVPSKTSR